MKQLIIILTFSLFAIACNQSDSNTKEKIGESPNEKIVVDSDNSKKELFVDSISKAMGNYRIISSKSYFFDSPDSLSKRKDYLEKDKLILVSKIANGFAYARPSDYSDSLINGWLLLKDLKQIFFTPPKLSN